MTPAEHAPQKSQAHGIENALQAFEYRLRRLEEIEQRVRRLELLVELLCQQMNEYVLPPESTRPQDDVFKTVGERNQPRLPPE